MYAIDGKHFLTFILNNASYVFIKPFFPIGPYETIPTFYRKNGLDINLRIGRHVLVFTFDSFGVGYYFKIVFYKRLMPSVILVS